MNESLCKAAQQHGYGDLANESARQVNSALAGHRSSRFHRPLAPKNQRGLGSRSVAFTMIERRTWGRSGLSFPLQPTSGLSPLLLVFLSIQLRSECSPASLCYIQQLDSPIPQRVLFRKLSSSESATRRSYLFQVRNFQLSNLPRNVFMLLHLKLKSNLKGSQGELKLATRGEVGWASHYHILQFPFPLLLLSSS